MIKAVFVILAAFIIDSSSKCLNPPDDNLDMRIFEYQRMLDKMEQRTLATRRIISTREKNRRQNNSSSSQLMFATDESMCGLRPSSSSLAANALCPFQYVVISRNNMYPRTRVAVKCGCSTCRTLDDNSFDDKFFGCRPVFRAEPALRQVNSTCVNGFYKWEAILEEVPIACTCSYL